VCVRVRVCANEGWDKPDEKEKTKPKGHTHTQTHINFVWI